MLCREQKIGLKRTKLKHTRMQSSFSFSMVGTKNASFEMQIENFEKCTLLTLEIESNVFPTASYPSISLRLSLGIYMKQKYL